MRLAVYGDRRPDQPEWAAERSWARNWLFDAALPLWFEKGLDRRLGGWFDKLDQHGNPVDLPKRLRVQARQVFVYVEASRLGWTGPWRDAVLHGLEFISARFKRPDGLYRAAVTPEGEPIVEMPDLYDQAFVLLALASSYGVLDKPAALLAEAEALLDCLEQRLSHSERGFEEACPRVLPLRSNPHMHLLEALLAWVEIGGGARFERHARAIIDLARERLIDPSTGAIGEFYDGHWNFHPELGHVREPGHQFEWAFLLRSADLLLGGDHTVWYDRLHRFGTTHGIRDGLAVFSVAADGGVVDHSARLWAQTERLRTMLVLAPNMPPADAKEAMAAAAESVATLKRFLDVPVRGLWIDRVDHHGNWLDEPAPASSFYHIMTGLAPLIQSPALEAQSTAFGPLIERNA